VETCESGTLPDSGRMVRSLAADWHLSDALNQIALEIARVAEPERIILFGSAARGEMGTDSDLDLLVLVSDADDPWQESFRIRRALRGYPYAMDIIVRPLAHFEHYKDVRGTIFYRAAREGRVLYDRAS